MENIIDTERYLETMINEVNTKIAKNEQEFEAIFVKIEKIDNELANLHEQLTFYTNKLKKLKVVTIIIVLIKSLELWELTSFFQVH